MTFTKRLRGRTIVAAAAGWLALAGCGLLDVSDPTAIEDSELNDANGALLLRSAAVQKWYTAVGKGAYHSGLMSDEYVADPPLWYEQGGSPNSDNLLDRRESTALEQTYNGGIVQEMYRPWQEVRFAAAEAIPKLRSFAAPDVRDPYIGEMFAIRAYATLRLAEDFCPGFPLHDVVNNTAVYGGPMSTDQVLNAAAVDFDSALAYAGDSTRILNFARVGLARTLLSLGRYDDAAALVTAVPTGFVQNAAFSTNGFMLDNPMPVVTYGGAERGVANEEGGAGLDFVTALDPRVPTSFVVIATNTIDSLFESGKSATGDDPIVAASGIEARLIQAEAKLHAGDPTWLLTLDTLRATQSTPALGSLSDPGTDAGRLDLLFRERAFWLFGTGHRLGDLRRLISRYGREANDVFPSGPYWRGGSYGIATAIPFPFQMEASFSPGVTGCTTR